MINITESIEKLIEHSLEKNPVEFKKVFKSLIEAKGKTHIRDLKESMRKTLFETEVKIIVKDGKAETEDNAIHAGIRDDKVGQEPEDNAIHASIHRKDRNGQ